MSATRPLHLRRRLRTAWEHERLDRRLADGADAATDPLLLTRAQHLVTPGRRARLAAGLERVVASVGEPSPGAAIPVRDLAVAGARHELMLLAGELRHMRDPRARGVALAQRLLTDPASPLHTATSSDEIATAATDAARALCPPGAAAPAGHRFCIPTVAQMPPRTVVESPEW
jgi:hypothetical protein